ncbi:SDR family NAD(P)-dependent oxidoreductase [Alkalihalobacillus sp. AL-G]|uniref:SDR family NAD(P)-dependent oxidoreductase n=1 Tax=Alkalihalobacillus sp. AL-G TaxID=2926399 RepID=UPI00272C94C7|nr:SDR family oxidoreductase [Alkalihalobacillus sp. AL-G]WLD92516.1 SDR family oxidoreductase [Alkalihalobacillus sp. AL-G]
MSIFAIDALEGRHILITGASGGIGSETAKTLVKMGAKVTLTGRDTKKLDLIKQELLEITPPGNVYIHIADLTNEQEQEQLVDCAEKELGIIYGLVNSAGASGGEVVEKINKDDLELIMELNYTATVMLSKTVYIRMKGNLEGKIVNVSSLSGLRGTYGNTAYAGSKFALIGFTQSFALEAIRNGINVNAVCPGYVNTAMARKAIEARAKRNGLEYEEQLKQAKEEIPSEHLTEPEEVASTIAFLLTDAAPNIVGESIKLSGGSVMR